MFGVVGGGVKSVWKLGNTTDPASSPSLFQNFFRSQYWGRFRFNLEGGEGGGVELGQSGIIYFIFLNINQLEMRFHSRNLIVKGKRDRGSF